MKPSFLLGALLLVASTSHAGSGKYHHSPCKQWSRTPGCAKKAHSRELQPYTARKLPDHGLADTMTALGKQARGFYVTAYWIARKGAKQTALMMKKAHMNAVVIDVKDDFGHVTYPSKVPLAKKVSQPYIKDLAAAVKTFHEHGIYVIGRLVAFKDSRLPYQRPDLAVRIGPRAERLFSAGANWLDHYSPEVQDYLIELSLELESHGVDEIQLDYIRFPKGAVTNWATWLHAENDQRDRSTLIGAFLERMDRALRIPMSVDVFGLTTLVDGDPRTLGQTIETMAKYVEAVSPMMYANGMRTYFKNDTVTEHVYSIIQCGLWRARQKAPAIVLRPFLQAYPDSVESFFGTTFIKRQIEVSERAGSNGFLFWNAGMRNGAAYAALAQLGQKRLEAFGSRPEQWKESSPGGWCPGRGTVFGGERPRQGRIARRADQP
jgi:hypothetical protein